MERIKKNHNFLKILSLSDKKLQNQIIDKSNKDQIYCLCEIVLNLLKGNINLSNQELKKLGKYKNSFRKLIRKSNIRQKKKVIQSGGFLSVLIPSIISALSPILSELIK